MKMSSMVLIAALLAGCGGGGGGGSSSTPASVAPAASTPAVTPQPTTTPTSPAASDPAPASPAPSTPAATVPYTISPGIISGSYVAGAPKTVRVTATPLAPVSGKTYIRISTNAPILPNVPVFSVRSDGSVLVDVLPSSRVALPGLGALALSANGILYIQTLSRVLAVNLK